MRRREFIAAVAGAAALRPLAAPAQQPKMATVGVLVVGSPGSERFWQLFRDDMRELGYVEGKNVRYEFRSDGGQASRLPALAAELVRLKPDAIVTWFTPAATAAKKATADIPIVMALAGDPIATGLVKSLARPGGNVTGMSGIAGGSPSAKMLQFIREMVPGVHRVAALVNAPDPFSKPFLESVRNGGAAAGITIEAEMIPNPEGLDAAFANLEKNRPDALIVQPSLPVRRVVQLALQHHFPAACSLRAFVDAGGLLSYWFAEAPLYRSAAIILDKILKGAKPADIPVEQPTRFELVINLKTAKALGLTVPQSLLAEADEVIE
ncbi:MAG TPA: ABC transporter substrate-binding protein [Stellaceae bacterium]|nr:ABC transporter substrate-binding protein [Stellaceae bacterium]